MAPAAATAGARPRWAGDIVREARAIVRRTLPAPCSRCGSPVDDDDDWHADHIPERDRLDPALWLSPDHLRPAHALCNTSAGAAYGHRKRRQRRHGHAESPFPDAASQPPPAAVQGIWAGLRADWSTPFTVDPRPPGESDGLPLVFPPPHGEAVASRGDEAVAWMGARMASAGGRWRGLRWWQWLVLQRMLEVRADGTWCWPVSGVSVGRQQGKTVLLGELACWLCSTAAEPPMELVHAANTSLIARKHQQLWVPWAESLGYQVRAQLADSQILWPDGTVWRTVASSNMWGRTLDAALLDEVWAWTPEAFWEGVYPTMVERPAALGVGFSAANDGDRGLWGTLVAEPSVMVALWGADPGCDRSDPAVWRAASASWSPHRERAMRIASTKPGFDTNWLNIWPDRGHGRWIAAPLTAAAGRWRVPRNPPEGAVCAVECSTDGRRWSVAAAWRTRAGTTARVWDAATVQQCLQIAGHRPVWAHGAVVERHDQVARQMLRPVSQQQHRAATGMLRDAVLAGRLHVAGVDDTIWEHVRCSPADGGEVIDARRSSGDVHAVKALAWAVWAVQSQAEPTFVL